jgi:hypothetical protein
MAQPRSGKWSKVDWLATGSGMRNVSIAKRLRYRGIVAEEGGTRRQPRPEIDPRELRVSDAEREHVASLLHKALARGLIDLDGFSSRIGTALGARTRAELNAVLVDLPGVVVRIDPYGRGG